MKLGLHTYANDELFVKFTCENDTERELLSYFFTNFQKIEGSADALNGVFISTKKKLK